MGETIGIDTVILISFLEDRGVHGERATAILDRVQKGEAAAIIASIGVIEILTGPKKTKQYEILSKYRDLLTHFPNLTIAGLTDQIIETASDLRASYGIATLDAIHLATAIAGNAHYFITNDKKLTKITEIKIKLLG